MICDHCNKPIPAGQAEVRTVDGASGGGGDVTLHRGWCPPLPEVEQPKRYPTGVGRWRG